MGYTPGPQFRIIRNHLIELQLDGEVSGRDEAIAFIRTAYPVANQPRR